MGRTIDLGDSLIWAAVSKRRSCAQGHRLTAIELRDQIERADSDKGTFRDDSKESYARIASPSS